MAALEVRAGGHRGGLRVARGAQGWQGHGGTSCVPLQVYVRRGYIAYELNSLQHQQLSDGTCLVEFQFMLPSSHPNRYRGPSHTPVLLPWTWFFSQSCRVCIIPSMRSGSCHRAVPLAVEQDEPSPGQGPLWELWSHMVPPPQLTLALHGRMSVPISISNPDLARHSTELFMDSGFSPTSQRMGVMVAFRRFEDFTRWGCRDMPAQCLCILGAAVIIGEQNGVEEPQLGAAGRC